MKRDMADCTLGKDVLTIRAATRDDVGMIHLLVGELAAFEGLSHAVSSRAGDIHEALFGNASVLNALVARVGHKIEGFASYYWTYSTFRGRKGLYIEDLFVRPSARRQGAGRALMEALAARAAGQCCDRMSWSVLDWNEEAIRFYRSLGATPVSDWLAYRLDDEGVARLTGKTSQKHTP